MLPHIRVRVPAVVVASAAVLVLVAGGAAPAAAQPSIEAACNIETRERIVAVGDIHGAYDQFVAILQAAGLIDSKERWSGGRAIFVQTGDVLSRGAHSRKVLDLLRRLEGEASRAGGRVYALLGNHEFMQTVAELEDVSPEEYEAFRTRTSEELRERLYQRSAGDAARRASQENRPFNESEFRAMFLKEIPLGFVEMRLAFSPTGPYGRWLREKYAIVRINGVAFLHGGLDLESAALGCEGINEGIRRDVTTKDPTPAMVQAMLSTKPTGPLWYRGLALEPDPEFAPEVANILKTFGARAIVIGHTPTSPRITSRFGGRVILIDTGMLGGKWYIGGTPSALEILGDSVTAIYEHGRTPLPPLPAPEGAAPAR
jgi:hypothetical protein